MHQSYRKTHQVAVFGGGVRGHGPLHFQTLGGAQPPHFFTTLENFHQLGTKMKAFS